MEPIDEHKLAVADKKPEKVDAPRQGYYIVDYKTKKTACMVALVIFLVWVAAVFVL